MGRHAFWGISFIPEPVAARLPNYGSKMGIDGTRKWKAEGFTRTWPKELEMSEEVKRRVDLLWPKLGLYGRRIYSVRFL